MVDAEVHVVAGPRDGPVTITCIGFYRHFLDPIFVDEDPGGVDLIVDQRFTPNLIPLRTRR